MLSKIFPRNENTIDRIIRVILGLGVLSLAFVGPKTPWGFAGAIFLVTGIVGSCPIYRLFGIDTCKLTPSPSQKGLPS